MHDDNDTDWVEVRRYDDAVEAEIALNFLRDHGVTAKILGHAGMTSVFNRFTTVMDIRVVVPDVEARTAREVLDAMVVPDEALVPDDPASAEPRAAGDGPAAPYRARPVPPPTTTEPTFRKRYRSGPVVLALPIPGGGHFYAQHNRAGLVFCAAVLSLYIVGWSTNTLFMIVAAMLCQVCDAVLGVAAVGRFNAGRVQSNGRQTAVAAGAVATSVVAALVLLGGPGARVVAPAGLEASPAE